MNHITTLLTPRLLSFKNAKDGSTGKLLIFGALGVVFWGGLFVVSLRVLNYFQSIEELLPGIYHFDNHSQLCKYF